LHQVSKDETPRQSWASIHPLWFDTSPRTDVPCAEPPEVSKGEASARTDFNLFNGRLNSTVIPAQAGNDEFFDLMDNLG